MNRLYYFIFLLILGISGCELDNYDKPSSPLSGRLVFEGKSLGIRQGISVLQLYQPGFENVTPIAVNVKQDGSFSSMLFNGTYKLVRISGNGPWENNPDTITVEVNGPTTIDVPVTPYFSINESNFSVENNILRATVRIANNVAGRQVERVSLIVGETIIVDEPTKLSPNPADPLSSKAGAGLDLSQAITLSQNLDVAPINTAPYLYARVGVKILGVTELIYSEVWKVNR